MQLFGRCIPLFLYIPVFLAFNKQKRSQPRKINQQTPKEQNRYSRMEKELLYEREKVEKERMGNKKEELTDTNDDLTEEAKMI